LIETRSLVSTDSIERFISESYRCSLTSDFDLPNQKSWDSNTVLGISDCQFINAGAQFPNEDFGIYNPNPLTQPDYSGTSGVVYLIREFKSNGLAYANAKINITGTFSTLEVKLAKAWDGTTSGGSVWMNALLDYNASQFNNGNPQLGTGCRTDSGATFRDVTFGSLNLINTNSTIYVKIGFTSGQRITALSVVFT
jgi:hypothetical protein